jgi:hypothetical protein
MGTIHVTAAASREWLAEGDFFGIIPSFVPAGISFALRKSIAKPQVHHSKRWIAASSTER